MAPKASTSKAAPAPATKRSRSSSIAAPASTPRPAASQPKKAKVDAAAAASPPQPKSILKKKKNSEAVGSTKSNGSRAPSSRRPVKSPLTAAKPVVSDAEDEDEDDEDFEGAGSSEGDAEDDSEGGSDSEGSSFDSDDEEEMLKGMTSDEDAGADSSDDDDSDDDDDDDAAAVGKLSAISTAKLPSSKDDEAVRARLAKVEARRKSQPASHKVDRAVLYVGHLPRHFTEDPLREYLSQFGTVTRLRLSRNKKTGASKHYAFVEFADDEVAKIVQETMDNYLILGQLLRVKTLAKDEIHPKLWIGANRAYRKVPEGARARAQHDGPKTQEGKQRAERKLLERQKKRKQSLKEQGYDYDFEGYHPVKA